MSCFIVLDIIDSMIDFFVVESFGKFLLKYFVGILKMCEFLGLGESVVFWCLFKFLVILDLICFLEEVEMLFGRDIFGLVMFIVVVKVMCFFRESMENFVSKIIIVSMYFGVFVNICWKSKEKDKFMF